MMKPNERQAWLLEDMKGVGRWIQSGWDWDADGRYATAVGADPEIIDLIDATLRSSTLDHHRLQAYYSPGWRRITRMRTADLRALTAAGRVSDSWSGMSPDCTGGATRTKSWQLNENSNAT